MLAQETNGTIQRTHLGLRYSNCHDLPSIENKNKLDSEECDLLGPKAL
jgi:hypothetical protein